MLPVIGHYRHLVIDYRVLCVCYIVHVLYCISHPVGIQQQVIAICYWQSMRTSPHSFMLLEYDVSYVEEI